MKVYKNVEEEGKEYPNAGPNEGLFNRDHGGFAVKDTEIEHEHY
jgi:hypothetical protein